MLCPVCKTEAAIMSGGYDVSGDTSSTEQTRVFRILKFSCRNKNCADFGKEIGEKRHEIFAK